MPLSGDSDLVEGIVFPINRDLPSRREFFQRRGCQTADTWQRQIVLQAPVCLFAGLPGNVRVAIGDIPDAQPAVEPRAIFVVEEKGRPIEAEAIADGDRSQDRMPEAIFALASQARQFGAHSLYGLQLARPFVLAFGSIGGLDRAGYLIRHCGQQVFVVVIIGPTIVVAQQDQSPHSLVFYT